jgi:hypothetical protein
MPLSEYEQKVLEQMERHLSSDDPRLANTLTQRRHRPASRYAIAVTGSVLGLFALVMGAHLSLSWLGAVGFVVMFAAIGYAFARPQKRGAGRQAGSRPARSASRAGFMSRVEERWNKRREQG